MARVTVIPKDSFQLSILIKSDECEGVEMCKSVCAPQEMIEGGIVQHIRHVSISNYFVNIRSTERERRREVCTRARKNKIIRSLHWRCDRRQTIVSAFYGCPVTIVSANSDYICRTILCTRIRVYCVLVSRRLPYKLIRPPQLPPNTTCTVWFRCSSCMLFSSFFFPILFFQ